MVPKLVSKKKKMCLAFHSVLTLSSLRVASKSEIFTILIVSVFVYYSYRIHVSLSI